MSTVSTFVGSPSYKDGTGPDARFNQPFGMVKVGGYLYVTDNANHIIRKVDAASGMVTTFAGSAGVAGNSDGMGKAASFREPMGIATDGTNLYVADSKNSTIRQIVIATGEVTTLAGKVLTIGSANGIGSLARFNQPVGLTVLGNFLYVTDVGLEASNNTIRSVSLTGAKRGTTGTIAGLVGIAGHSDGGFGSSSFNNPWGIATDGKDLFVADTWNHTIRKIVVATKMVSTVAGTAGVQGYRDGAGTAATFDNPTGLATDGTYLFVSDPNNQEIRSINISMGVVSTLAGLHSNPETFADGVGSGASFWTPSGLAVDGATLFVADMSNSLIRKVNTTTTQVTTLAGTTTYADGVGTAAGLNLPQYVTTDGSSLFVVDRTYGSIRQVAISTGVVSTFLLFGSCNDITTNGLSLFYISDDQTIHSIDIASGNDVTVAGGAQVQVSTDGVGTAASFLNPSRITTDGVNLYVTDSNAIRKVVIATGGVSTLAGSASTSGRADGAGVEARFNGPQGITTDGVYLYISDTGNNSIRKVVIATGVVTTIAGSTLVGNSDGMGSAVRFNKPQGITTDGKTLFVVDTGNNEIRQIDLASGVVQTSAGDIAVGDQDGDLSMARFNSPQSITTDGISLFVADMKNSTIRKLMVTPH